ncbi:MAG TPA: hypothetical protein PKI61_02655 [bacterium]|nr:hypothetical protein [bacterium]HPT29753.1 hypothetical protein [bacterium]
MKNNLLNTISCELFYALTGAIILFIVLEIIKPLSVLTYFNLNYLVVLWIISAALFIFSKK